MKFPEFVPVTGGEPWQGEASHQGRDGFFSSVLVCKAEQVSAGVRVLWSWAALPAILLEVHHYPYQCHAGSLSHWVAGAVISLE